MSYDLLVFDPAEAPRDRTRFLQWFQKTLESADGVPYDDPAHTTPNLRAWFDNIRRIYPPLDGPLATEDYENPNVTDYSIGHHAIYASFGWPVAETAYTIIRELAVKHAVGFYDASGDEGDGEIYFPGDTLRPPSKGAWREISKQFQDISDKLKDKQ